MTNLSIDDVVNYLKGFNTFNHSDCRHDLRFEKNDENIYDLNAVKEVISLLLSECKRENYDTYLIENKNLNKIAHKMIKYMLSTDAINV